MRIKTVTFSQSIETVYGYGLKKWTKASSEIEFEEATESPDNAYALAKQLVKEQIAKELSEHTEQMGVQEKIITAHRPKDTKEALIYDISSCTDLKVLETYKFLSSKYPEIEQAYIQKHKELYNEGN